MAERDAWELSLYRFAVVLLRNAELARTVTLETLESAALKPPACADDERLAMSLFQTVRRRALKLVAGTAAPTRATRGDLAPDAAVVVSAARPADVEAAIHALPEPGRSALALLLLDAMEADNVAKLLGLTAAEFANVLHAARLSLHGALTAVPPLQPPSGMIS